MKYSFSGSRYSLSLCVSILIALKVWWIFDPGVISLDSLLMYMDADRMQFSTIRPLLATLVLSVILNLGGDIDLVIFFQIILGVLGIRKFIIVFSKFMGLADDRLIDALAAILLMLLFSPITIYSVYFSTFWTDIWLSIALIWALSFLIEFHTYDQIDGIKFWKAKLVLLLISSCVAVTVRSNAIVLLPSLWYLVYRVFQGKAQIYLAGWFRHYKIMALLMPLTFYLAFTTYQNSQIGPDDVRTEYASYALDLSSMIVYEPSICNDLYLTSCTLVQNDFPHDFLVGHGAIDFTLNQEPTHRNLQFFTLFANPRLTKEYYYAAREFPMLLIKVKLLNYFDYLSRNPQRYFYQAQNSATRSRSYFFDQPHRNMVEKWFSRMDAILLNPILSWFSFVHLPWFILNFVELGICLMLIRKNKRAWFLFLLLLVPASYYASYLLVFTASEFRFMFPSMIIVQMVTIIILISKLVILAGHIRP